MSKKIYIRGAYGPGNLGDDVLLLCMVKIVGEVFSPENIYVGVENIELAKSSLGLACNIVHYKQPMAVDAVVYGGGGQFFTFKDSQKPYEKESFFLRLKYFLKNNRNVSHALKRLLYSRDEKVIENLLKTNNVGSYSIGLGPFETEGKGTKRLREFSNRASFVSLRDNKSVELYKEICPKADAPLLTADPSFLSGDWFVQPEVFTTTNKYDFTYIVRAWPYSADGRQMILNMIDHCKEMSSKNYKVRLVSLFGEYDQELIDEHPTVEWLVYDLEVHTIYDFLSRIIHGSKYIISARAHGVWLPTILGYPVLAVGIENKLEQVAKSLEKCTNLVKGTDKKTLNEAIDTYVQDYDKLQANISESLTKNVDLATNARNEFQSWLRNVYN